MARVISDDKLNEKLQTAEVGELAIPELEELVNSLDGPDTEKWEQMAEDLRENFPGIGRSILANFKQFKECRDAMRAVLVKFKAEVQEAKDSYEKSKKNKEHVPSSGSAKSGSIMYIDQKEYAAGKELSNSFKLWLSGFRGNVKEMEIPATYATSLRKEISDDSNGAWSGNKMLVKKDKKEYILESQSNGDIKVTKV